MAVPPPAYDEFGLFHENAAEVGLALARPPVVERVAVDVGDDRHVSALRWGTEEPELVLLHGGGQNAHTWDTVALALGRPLVALDLPGHGHSADIHPERPVGPRSFAHDVAAAIEVLAPDAQVVVGMSLGGLTALQVCAIRADLVRRLAMIDVTPGANRDKTADIVAFLSGPESFESFEEILERTVLFNPTRSESSLRRGILHNAYEREDGRWVWRHQRTPLPGHDAADGTGRPAIDFGAMWDDLAAVAVPVHLYLGDRSPVVDEDDRARFLEAQPSAEVITVADAGHSIQGDQPLVLAEHLRALLA